MENLITRKTNFIIQLLFTFVLLLSLTNGNAQTDNPKYNKQLADSLGADDYGMKMYVLVIVKPGSVKIDDKKKSDSLFRGHMQNIGHLVEIGKLMAAGPVKKNDKKYEGIIILDVKTIEEAKTLLEADPAIQANILETELYQWYGSAALPMYIKFHYDVMKKDY